MCLAEPISPVRATHLVCNLSLKLVFRFSAFCLMCFSTRFALLRMLHYYLRIQCALLARRHIFINAGTDNLRVGTIAGSGSAAFANGVGSAASFSNPFGVVVDANGLAYISDSSNNRVRQIALSTGAVTTLAGSGAAASTDGTGAAAAFFGPQNVALDGLGNLYVTDFDGHRIRKVVLTTLAVVTVAGTGFPGAIDGEGTVASFRNPRGIASDYGVYAYVADCNNHRIRKIVLSSATVTTLAGSSTPSSSNGVGTSAGFYYPVNVALDSSGTMLFVAEYTNRLIRQIAIATQAVTTLAGSGTAGSANGIGVAAQFNIPWGLAVDSSGNLFVGDTGSQLIRRVVIATQTVTTVAGSGAASWLDGFGTNVAFNHPSSLAIDARGNMVVVDSSSNRVRVLQRTVPCTPGYYCATGADRAPCSAGYYCPAASSSATQFACTPGHYCLSGSSAATLCAASFYCPEGTATPIPCPADNTYCPIGSAAPISIACPIGCGPCALLLFNCIAALIYSVHILPVGFIFARKFSCHRICNDQSRHDFRRNYVWKLYRRLLLRRGLVKCVWRHQRN
jgi:sugar lactone lactonase YvrE